MLILVEISGGMTWNAYGTWVSSLSLCNTSALCVLLAQVGTEDMQMAQSEVPGIPRVSSIKAQQQCFLIETYPHTSGETMKLGRSSTKCYPFHFRIVQAGLVRKGIQPTGWMYIVCFFLWILFHLIVLDLSTILQNASTVMVSIYICQSTWL